MINKKGFTLPADIFATITLVAILVLYVVLMIGGTFEGGRNELTSNYFDQNSEVNLYSYLNSPIDNSRMADVLIEYADSDFKDTNLKDKIIFESKEILKKLNFCADGEIYFGVITIGDKINDADFIIYYPETGNLINEYNNYINNKILDKRSVSQRLPYNKGFFWVTYYQSFIEDDMITGKISCEEELTYE